MASANQSKGTPPTGCVWGERTQQAEAIRSGRPVEYWESDVYEIRQCYGIPEFDVEEYLASSHLSRMVYPDAIVHERDPTLTKSTKGTDVLIKGDRDSGKTTFARWVALRLMQFGERVIWRGRSDGSGWLPLRHWAQVFLPANASIQPVWMNEGEDAELEPLDDIESVARNVCYYEDVNDLLDQLGEMPPGSFNVVYPDPSFAGCEAATEPLENVAGTLPFTPAWEADTRDQATPLIHWWFAFWFARKERGPFVWMSLIFDEVGDWLEEGASQETSRLYDKIKSLRKVWAASRKRLMSMYFFAHKESNVHWMIREEFKWRIHMPDESPNPHMRVRSTLPQGMDKVPMEQDIMSDMEVGTGLIYTQNEFAMFTWDDLSDPSVGDRWLSIKLNPPAHVAVDGDDDVELEFDDELFAHWEGAHQSRLVVHDPGAGYIDLRTGELSDNIASPVEGLAFDGTIDRGAVLEVLMVAVDGDNAGNSLDDRIPVARVPKSELDPQAGRQEVTGL